MSRPPVTARDIPFTSSRDRIPTVFDTTSDGRYTLTVPGLGMVLEADRLRWERSELRGELTVRCELAGVSTPEGVLTSGSFNLSYLNARRDQAKYIADRASVAVAEVSAALEELCHRVLTAERAGKPAALLHSFPKPTADAVHDMDGLVVPQHHPAILFGDGGCGKSYIALLLLGILARRGHRVMYCDWELDGRDHRERLERLFGDQMPAIHYVRCDRPMTAEADRLRRLVAQHRIEYAVFDSVAFACDGPPESAEAAASYFRAVRQLGAIGSLHLAHVTKPSNDPAKSDKADYKPFGSVFWHNAARACWFVKRADPASDADGRVVVGLYHRKSNLGALREAIGLELVFTDTATTVGRTDLADVAELAKGLPVWKRMKAALNTGPLSMEALAEEIDAKEDTIRRLAGRMEMFTKITSSDGRKLVALTTRRTA